MKNVILITVTFPIIFVAAISARIINVPNDYNTIQQGINASVNGDTVLVQPGIYYENINFNGHSITLGSLFLISGDTTHISETIIDGDSVDTVVKIWSEELAFIIGFTIRNGAGHYGGGISCRYSDPLIANNVIIQNTSDWAGGGIFCWSGSNPTIQDNTISDNYALDGGGIWMAYSHPTIDQNNVSNNIAIRGAGVSIVFCDRYLPLVISNTIIAHNEASIGGGVYGRYSSFSIVNTTVTENLSDNPGAGLYLEDTFKPVIANSIFWANSEDEVYVVGEWADSLVIVYSNIQDTVWVGQGNISDNPQFRYPENGDFHLMSIVCGDTVNSSCIDAGDPFIFDNLLDCGWGLGGERSDMGAYGGRGIPTSLDNYDIQIPLEIIVSQNYPNPFNAQTTFEYALPEASHVTVEIYDLLGRHIETLVDAEKPAGYNQATWDASNQASGMYFYKITAGEFIETKKMTLLK